MAMADAICEAYCEAWRIINQLHTRPTVITKEYLEELAHNLHILKGHVESLAATAAPARPEAAKELTSIGASIELILFQLRQENPPLTTIYSTITSIRNRINDLREELGCRC